MGISKKKRILYIAHGHPDFSYGGAEWAAYYMYQAMKDDDEYESFFLARYEKNKHHHAGCNLMRHEADDHVHLLATNQTAQDYYFNSFSWDSLDEVEDLHYAFRDLLEKISTFLERGFDTP